MSPSITDVVHYHGLLTACISTRHNTTDERWYWHANFESATDCYLAVVHSASPRRALDFHCYAKLENDSRNQFMPSKWVNVHFVDSSEYRYRNHRVIRNRVFIVSSFQVVPYYWRSGETRKKRNCNSRESFSFMICLLYRDTERKRKGISVFSLFSVSSRPPIPIRWLINSMSG